MRGPLLALGLVMLLVTGCAQKTLTTGFVTTGEGMIALGNEFTAVSAVYAANCKPAARVPEYTTFCTQMAAFIPKFQRSYPLAVQAWTIAVEANDVNQAQGAMATLMDLATRLTELALVASGGTK